MLLFKNIRRDVVYTPSNELLCDFFIIDRPTVDLYSFVMTKCDIFGCKGLMINIKVKSVCKELFDQIVAKA